MSQYQSELVLVKVHLTDTFLTIDDFMHSCNFSGHKIKLKTFSLRVCELFAQI
jgi:hypothetical protein